MSTNRIISYTRAENLCKGSLGDANYSTCVLNNLRFLPYMNDTAEALLKTNAGLTTQGDIPYLDGKTYVEAQPIAISDTMVKMLEKNDYGQVSFRCLDVMAKPMLPLMDLTDLGLEDKPLVVLNNLDLPTVEENENLCDASNNYLSGVPVKCPENCGTDDCLYSTYLYNLKNYLIHLNNKYQTALSNCDAIATLIAANGNYDNLRPMALEAQDSLNELETVYNVLTTMKTKMDALTVGTDYYNFLQDMIGAVYTLLPALSDYTTERDNLNTNVVQVILTYVTDNEDWTTFQYYTELDGIVTYMDSYRDTENYFLLQEKLDKCLLYLNTLPYIPEIDSTNDSFSSLVAEVALNFNYEIYSELSSILIKIQELYTLNTDSKKIDLIKQKNTSYKLFSNTESVWLTEVKNLLTTNNFNNSKATDILDLYTLLENVRSLYSNTDDFITNLGSSVTEAQLDSYYSNYGNQTLVSLSVLYSKLQDILELAPTSINEVDLGGSFKDAGRYYFANVAYAIGFGKLTDIYSIKINGAIYTTEAITDDNGNAVTGISDSGCTRYKLRFKLFPDVANNSNIQVLEMYIYPGTPDQPYCPTINKYHNFAAASYSGLFSKLLVSETSESTEIGLYMFKGYYPLENKVNKIIRLGTADLNAIDLTKPDLDKDSTEAFLQKEIVSLTNSSSLIASNVITSKDLKFYLKATLQGTEAPIETNNPFVTQGLSVPKASNYPNMSIIEFISLPLGSSFKVPNIEIYLRAEDMVS